jgi:hypothetical protein
MNTTLRSLTAVAIVAASLTLVACAHDKETTTESTSTTTTDSSGTTGTTSTD